MSDTIFDLECCPHCESKSGFTYLLTTTGIQFYPWKNSDAEPAYTDSKSYGKHGAYRCDECGKIIKPKHINA